MRPVRVMGIVIVVIALVFIVLITDLLVKVNTNCLTVDGRSIIRCGLQRFSIDIVFGLTLIILFMFLAVSAVYLMKANPMM